MANKKTDLKRSAILKTFGSWDRFNLRKEESFSESEKKVIDDFKIVYNFIDEMAEVVSSSILKAMVDALETLPEKVVFQPEKVVENQGWKVPVVNDKTSGRLIPHNHNSDPNNKNSEKKVVDIVKYLQHAVAVVVHRHRDKNRATMKSEFDRIDSECKNLFNQWSEMTRKLNSKNNDLEVIMSKIHFPKARMAYWVKKEKE